MTPDQVLDRAADLLERDGWQRNEDGPSDPTEHAPRCTYGALRAAVWGRSERFDFEAEVRDALLAEVKSHTISGWNDHKAKDRRQVVRALRRTARKLRGAKR